MSHRHSAFKIVYAPSPNWDGVFSAFITDSEGPQGPKEGAKMLVAGNSLLLIGKALDEYMAGRILGESHHLIQPGLVTCNVDGGSRNNPGPSAVGVVVREGGDVVGSIGECIPDTTNNVAEYSALIRALEETKDSAHSGYEFIGDAELVVQQVEGQRKVKNPNLQKLHHTVRSLLSDREAWSLRHVPRFQNSGADKLVNAALNERR